MIAPVAGSIIDFNAPWKIIAVSVSVSVCAGAGVFGAFGYVLLGVSRYRETQGSGDRSRYILLIAVGGAFCLAAVVIGLIAMTHK
jgi:hypothetical protein